MVRRKKFLELRVTLSADAWCVKLSGAATVMLWTLLVGTVSFTYLMLAA